MDYKCIILGNKQSNVKTRLAYAMHHRAEGHTMPYEPHYMPTVWDSKRIEFGSDSASQMVNLWVGSGEEYSNLRKLNYDYLDSILLVFSFDDADSFESIKEMWLPELQKFCSDTPITLVGIKAQTQEVNCQDVEDFVSRNKIPNYVECSLTEPDDINHVIQAVLKTLPTPRPAGDTFLSAVGSSLRTMFASPASDDKASDKLTIGEPSGFRHANGTEVVTKASATATSEAVAPAASAAQPRMLTGHAYSALGSSDLKKIGEAIAANAVEQQRVELSRARDAEVAVPAASAPPLEEHDPDNNNDAPHEESDPALEALTALPASVSGAAETGRDPEFFPRVPSVNPEALEIPTGEKSTTVAELS